MQIAINGQTYPANSGETILEVARRNNILIPTLCHSEALPGATSCRLCIVEIHSEGKVQNVASCSYPVSDGMVVVTECEALAANRRRLLQMYQLMAPESKRIQNLVNLYQAAGFQRLPQEDGNKCILCGLCVKACNALGASALSTLNRGTLKKIGTAFNEPPAACIGCGSCYNVCPTEAIEMTDVEETRTIWGRTFTLLLCSECGALFTTAEAQAHIRQKLGDKASGAAPVCETCKAKQTAANFRDRLFAMEGI